MSFLYAENICKSFGDKKIIENVNIRLEEGELVCILGLSGSGKTTLFNCISGIMKPEKGNVYLKKQNITGQAGHISYMLQKDLLFPYKKVIDNVSLPLIIKGVSKREARVKASEHFEQFGLSGTENQYPCELSGGMRQRAALLRTYLSSEGAVLLDEPFSALDAITKTAMHKWYLDIMEKIKLSTLFITHDIDEAILLSDRIYILGGSPATVAAELKIDVPHSQRKDFNLTEEFLAYKKEIIEKLN